MIEDPIPQYFREYEVLDVIGEGGMGEVYKVRHIYLDEERAIKIIRKSVIRQEDQEETIGRFIREAKILTRLRHPNVVLLYDFGVLENDMLFMVMEYIIGESVLSRLRRLERIPIDQSIRIIREAALGLQSAHQQGIIHRDVSPDNLLIVKQEDSREITKLIDFGIAKILLKETINKMDSFLGKPQYCSPEQLTKGAEVDHRADIYSLGATLYHMVTGALPFQSKSLVETVTKVLKEVPAPPSRHFSDGDFPRALDRIILKAMSKNPAHRYSSMEHLVHDLEGIISPDSLEGETAFLPQANHEIRTRLNVIIGYSEMLEEDASQMGLRGFVHDLKKVTSAGKHVLWYIGGDVHPEENRPGQGWSQFQEGKFCYDRMEWERAIECWQTAQEGDDQKMAKHWIDAAQARLNTEQQIRSQLTAQLLKCAELLDQRKILEVKAIMDDVERNLSSSYRLRDLKQQWYLLLKRLKTEIDAVLKEYGRPENKKSSDVQEVAGRAADRKRLREELRTEEWSQISKGGTDLDPGKKL